MIRTIFDPEVRADLVRRVNCLSPESERHWGKMTAGQMLVHTTGQLRIGLGELEVQPRRLPMCYHRCGS